MALEQIIPYLFVMALYTPAGAFLAVAGWLLGPMDDTKELGVVTLFTGFFQTISIILLFIVGNGFGAVTVVPLAFAWYILGITAIAGFAHFRPLANTLIPLVIFYVVEAIYLLTTHAIMLPIMILSYAVVVTMLIIWIYKGYKGLQKPTAYVLILEGILTILLPTLMFMTGIPLP